MIIRDIDMVDVDKLFSVIRMTDVGGGCRRLLGEGEDFCLFSTHLLVVSVIGLSR